MWLKYPIIIFAFFILALIQNSFLASFTTASFIPNLIFILFFFLAFLEQSHYRLGIFVVVLAGFITELFTPFYFGPAIVSFLLVYIFIKIILYFLKERKNEYLLFYVVPIFLMSLIFYNALMHLFLHFPHLQIAANKNMFITLAYNTILAMGMFFVYQQVSSRRKKTQQLRLFR